MNWKFDFSPDTRDMLAELIDSRSLLSLPDVVTLKLVARWEARPGTTFRRDPEKDLAPSS
jgi:hypothetical protein